MSDPLERIAAALERMAPPPAVLPDLRASAYLWHADPDRLQPVPEVARVALDLLVGIDRQKATLMENTRRFTEGRLANNALLWGARGSGKSSLVKAVHGAMEDTGLKLVELQREDIPSIDRLLRLLRGTDARWLLYCDDLSFSHDDAAYKALKAVLDGGVEGRPANVLFYATSNRRHLMPRDMIENERGGAIDPSEAVEEKVSLSDRFGLWLGFHACDQEAYLAMIDGYVRAHGLGLRPEDWRADALEWQVTRGARSGRVAWQFFTDLAGRAG